MKKSEYKIIFNLYFKFFIAFFVLILIFTGTTAYLLNVSISSKNAYANWSSWPVQFTFNFSKKINFHQGKPELTASAIRDLKKLKLSFQIVDKDGNVALGYNEPQGALKHYAPIEMVELYKSGEATGKYTMFVGSTNNNGEKWTYIIGFPAKISKITFYLSYNNFAKLKFVILGLVMFLILLIAIYGIWINRVLSRIILSIKKLASNDYMPLNDNGTYKEVFHNLNLLNTKLKTSEDERKRTEALREEWIANISHDLKTPLSPIKGYAEMLTDSNYIIMPEDVKRYGEIILRNTQNVENIVENLNFTYQLKNGMLPINRKEGNMVRLLKEVIISILNHPEYEKRNIIFNCLDSKINFSFDDTLLRRAFTNLLYNSVIHNEPCTIIKVSIKQEDKIYITIEDNGKGMTDEQVKRLFERYYRGTNSSLSVKGSGLGMAISKQIIEAHQGEIKVESNINMGTKIDIKF